MFAGWHSIVEKASAANDNDYYSNDDDTVLSDASTVYYEDNDSRLSDVSTVYYGDSDDRLHDVNSHSKTVDNSNLVRNDDNITHNNYNHYEPRNSHRKRARRNFESDSSDDDEPSRGAKKHKPDTVSMLNDATLLENDKQVNGQNSHSALHGTFKRFTKRSYHNRKSSKATQTTENLSVKSKPVAVVKPFVIDLTRLEH